MTPETAAAAMLLRQVEAAFLDRASPASRRQKPAGASIAIIPQNTSNSVLKTKTEASLAGAASCARAAVGRRAAEADAERNNLILAPVLVTARCPYAASSWKTGRAR